MEKIFNFSVKFGKYVSIFLLTVVTLIILSSTVNLLMNLKPITMEYPSFAQLSLDATIANNDTTTSKDKNAKQYLLTVNKIVKANDLNQYGKNILLASIANVEESKRDEYVKGLELFIPEFYQFMKAKKGNVTELDLREVLMDYNTMFSINWSAKEIKTTQQTMNKIVSGTILISSLILFIMCLIVPLLIRIEENTRK